MVNGSRYINGDKKDTPLYRRVGQVVLDKATWEALEKRGPALVKYKLTETDVKGPFRPMPGSMYGKVMDYLYKEDGSDWALVARRLEEVVAVNPGMVGAAVELGNAHLRLGDRASALRAYRLPLQQQDMPLDATLAGQFREQIARVEAAADPRQVPALRNPWLE